MTVIAVDLKSLEKIVIEYIKDAEFEEFARIAGEVLGGECWYWGDEEFHFEPNDKYTGSLNNFEELPVSAHHGQELQKAH